jgi:hypothetical protein
MQLARDGITDAEGDRVDLRTDAAARYWLNFRGTFGRWEVGNHKVFVAPKGVPYLDEVGNGRPVKVTPATPGPNWMLNILTIRPDSRLSY